MLRLSHYLATESLLYWERRRAGHAFLDDRRTSISYLDNVTEHTGTFWMNIHSNPLHPQWINHLRLRRAPLSPTLPPLHKDSSLYLTSNYAFFRIPTSVSSKNGARHTVLWHSSLIFFQQTHRRSIVSRHPQIGLDGCFNLTLLSV